MKKNEFTASLIEEIQSEINLDRISIEENFFDLGGDSLLALKICDQVQAQLGVTLELHSFFSFPTLSAMIDHVWTCSNNSENRENILLSPASSSKSYIHHNSIPLNRSQLLTLNFCKANPHSTANNLTSVIRIKKESKLIDVRKKLDELSLHYEVLRYEIVYERDHVYFTDLQAPNFQFTSLNLTDEEAISFIEKNLATPIESKDGRIQDKLLQVYQIETAQHYIIYTKFHHILIDGLSNLEFFKAMLEDSMIKRPLSAHEFLEAEKEYRNSPDYKSDQEFWLTEASQLKDLLKLDLNRGNTQTIRFTLTPDLESDLEAMAQINHCSLFQVLLALNAIVLKKLSHKDTISIGIPTHGRLKPKFFRCLGNYINTLPIILDFQLNNQFEHILTNTSDKMNALLAHQRFPTLDLIQLLAKRKQLALYDSIFSYLDLTKIHELIDEKHIEAMNFQRQDTFSPLDIYYYKIGDKFDICIEANSELPFLDELSQYQSVLEEVIGLIKSDSKLIQSSDNDNNEIEASQYIIGTKNCEHSSYGFLERILVHLESHTILAEDEQTSYTGIDMAKRIGHYQYQIQTYLKKTVSQDQKEAPPFLLFSQRNGDAICIQLALIFSKIPFIPIDPETPFNRIKSIIQSSKAKFYINSTPLPLVELRELEVLSLELQKHSSQEGYKPYINRSRPSDSTCYILYTSGSTGIPKGVEVSYQNLSYFLHCMEEELQQTDSIRALAQTTFSFDITFLEYLLPLMLGGYFYIVNQKEKLNIGKLGHLVFEKQINFIQATPSFWNLIINGQWPNFPNLIALSGGEAIDRSLVHKIIPKVKDLYNMYGPTETTIWSSFSRLRETGPVSIGLPLKGTQFFILDQDQKPVPQGKEGELYIAGFGVSKGYIHNKEKTEKAFLSLNLNAEKVALYRTGDIVLYDGDQIFHRGRKDSQFKINGHRVELDEIKVEILQFLKEKQIAATSCYILPIKRSNFTSIYGIIESTSIEHHQIDQLLAHLKQNLPSYMMPKEIIVREEIPTLINQKVDIQSLTNAIEQLKYSRLKDSHLEHSLSFILELCREVLNLEKTPKEEDNFFSLGGNSLLAIEFIDQIHSIYNIEISLDEFFQLQNLQSLKFSILSQEKMSLLNSDHFKYLISYKDFDIRKDSLFFIHGVGGGVLNYQHFKYLDYQKNVFGLSCNGIVDELNPCLKIEEMALNYVEEMKQLGLEGEITLIGGSMGGVIAYEMGQVLERMNIKVKEVIIVDTYYPTRPSIAHYLLTSLKFWKCYIHSLLYRHLKRPLSETQKYKVIELRNHFALTTYHMAPLLNTPLTLIIGTMNAIEIDQNEWQQKACLQFKSYRIDSNHGNMIESFKLFHLLKQIV